MNYKYAAVVNTAGRYISFVLVFLEQLGEGIVQEQIQHYALRDGERLVDAPPPSLRPHAGGSGFVQPCWGGDVWEEGATAEEISCWELAHPPSAQPSTPTSTEQLRADVDYIAVMAGVAL